MLTTLLPLLIGGLVIFGIARYNKSNKLFWQLLMAFLFGIACGAIGKKTLGKSTEKKDGITCVIPMQSSSALTIMEAPFLDAALPEETLVHHCTHSVGLVYAYRDMMPLRVSTGNNNPEEDIGISIEPVNTS